MGRIEDNWFIIDVRTLQPGQDKILADILKTLDPGNDAIAMTQKFTAKDIQFLKAAPDAPELSAPEIYYSDLISDPTTGIYRVLPASVRHLQLRITFVHGRHPPGPGRP